MGRPLRKDFLHVIYVHPFDDSRRLITKQKGSHRYTTQSNGNTVYTLVATTDLDPKQAYMLAYDSYGNSYFVTKLTRHHAVIHQYSNNEAEWQFANPADYPNGQSVKIVITENNGNVSIHGATAYETVSVEWDD